VCRVGSPFPPVLPAIVVCAAIAPPANHWYVGVVRAGAVIASWMEAVLG
jgi:hypothetical protein